MKLSSKLFLSLALVTFLAVPTGVTFANVDMSQMTIQKVSSVQSVAEMEALIAKLQAMIKAQSSMPKAELSTFSSNVAVINKTNCAAPIARVLKFGDKGEDVRVLNDSLEKEGFKIEGDRATFSSATLSAVNSYQLRNKEAILTKNGLTSPTGIVGVSTREKLNEKYCAPTVTKTGRSDVQPAYVSAYPITIVTPTMDQQLEKGSSLKVKWSFNSSAPKEFLLRVSDGKGQSFFPGEAVITENGVYSWGGDGSIPGFMKKVGKYQLQFLGLDKTDTPSDNPVISDLITFFVVKKLDEPKNSSLTMVYPNGGEIFTQGGTYDASPVTWKSKNVSSVYLKLQNAQGYTFGVSENMDNDGSYVWTVPTTLPNGQYKMSVISSNTDAGDYSDKFFLISNPASPDINDDGKVDGEDLGLLLGAWGACTANPCPGDITGEGFVDNEDTNKLLAHWGPLP